MSKLVFAGIKFLTWYKTSKGYPNHLFILQSALSSFNFKRANFKIF